MNKNVAYAIILYVIGQAMVWFQSNGQFMWPFFKKYPLLIACIGIPISYIFINGTRLSYSGYGVLWPGRMLGFAVGVIIFAILSQIFMGEQINLKTGLCLFLSFLIICIQIFMK
jgi:hypothetical protein